MDLFLVADSIDITPGKPVALAGFAERHGAYNNVHDKLEINLAALKQGDKYALLYSIDTLFVPDDFVQLVLDKFGAEYNLREEDIWMAATHTHFAPALDKEKPGLGRADETYCAMVEEKLLLLTSRVLRSQYKKVSANYGKSHSALNVNRRKKLLRPKEGLKLYWKTLMYPDFGGYKDDLIQLVRFDDESGNTQLVLWNYACHPVGFKHRSQVSADFPGLIRTEFRGYLKNDSLPVIFFLGFAGNIKPDVTPVTHTRSIDRLNYFFQFGPKYTRFPSTELYLEWIGLLWKEVKTALKNATKDESTALQTSQVKLPLNEIIGDGTGCHLQIKKLQLSERALFIGLSAEVLAEYKDIVADALKGKPSLNVGCLAGTRIYLPADKHIPEGGYEVHWFQHRFGIEGEFKPGLDEKIKTAVSKL